MLKVSAPGRICLFGEHQDYLGLPVIASAISLRIRFEGAWIPGKRIVVDLPDISSSVEFELDGEEVSYSKNTKYFKSVYNLLLRKGYTFSRGIRCAVRGEIPINAGTSSSSALVVAWTHFLAVMSDQQIELDALKTAEYAYLAEVAEFGEYGGMMDQYSSAVGDVIHLRSIPDIFCRKIDMEPGEIILADSLDPKNTQGMLSSVRSRAEDMLAKIPSFDIHSTSLSDAVYFESILSSDEYKLLRAIITSRDITVDALGATDSLYLGKLLSREHDILRDVLGTSTSKIDGMVDAALNAGAYGAKINGSGGGGCMFATTSTQAAEEVIEALKSAGGRVWRVKVDRGVTIE